MVVGVEEEKKGSWSGSLGRWTLGLVEPGIFFWFLREGEERVGARSRESPDFII